MLRLNGHIRNCSMQAHSSVYGPKSNSLVFLDIIILLKCRAAFSHGGSSRMSLHYKPAAPCLLSTETPTTAGLKGGGICLFSSLAQSKERKKGCCRIGSLSSMQPSRCEGSLSRSCSVLCWCHTKTSLRWVFMAAGLHACMYTTCSPKPSGHSLLTTAN